MQVSKQPLSAKYSRELYRALCQLLADVTSPEEAEVLLNELLSETERVAVMKRLAIASMLSEHVSYDTIKKTVKVSSATIASVQERMGKKGWVMILEKLAIHKTAVKQADTILNILGVFRKKK
jgi:uncharacterized protein YerC